MPRRPKLGFQGGESVQVVMSQGVAHLDLVLDERAPGRARRAWPSPDTRRARPGDRKGGVMSKFWLGIWNGFPDWSQVALLNLGKIFLIVVPLVLAVAYLTYAERKIIGYMQVRIGPNRVGPRGWLQPIADVVKLLLKEIIVPTRANRFLFVLAPILAFAPALAAWAVIPFTDNLWLSNIDAGL